MTDSVTPNYSWAYPTVGGDSAVWGGVLNAAFIAADASLHTVATAACQKASNLSDLASASTARTNLGLGTAATQASTAFVAAGAACLVANNLSDVTAATARTNLGLGTAAVAAASGNTANPLASVSGGTMTVNNFPKFLDTVGTVGDSTFNSSSFLKTANNLSEVTASTARTNLGLGSAATRNYTSGTAAPSGGSSGDLYGQHA